MMNGYKQNKRDLQLIRYLLPLLFLFPLTLIQLLFTSTTHTTNVSATPTVPTNPGFAYAKVSVARGLALYADSNAPNRIKDLIVDSTSTQSVSTAITCSNTTNCSNGSALLTSQRDQASSVEVATSPLEHGASTALLLLALGGGLVTAHVIRLRRARTSRLLQADQAEWDRRTTILAQEIKTMETTRRDWAMRQLASEQRSALSSTALIPRIEFDAADIRADINARQLREQKGR
jgi:hypothetical protein